MSFRRLLATACFAALALAAVDLRLLRTPFQDRGAMERHFTLLPDRGGWAPEYIAFLGAVRANTQRGDTIALVIPAKITDDGYSYAFFRASYFLAGREVLPVRAPDRVNASGNIRDAKYVALWPSPTFVWPSTAFVKNRVVLRQHGGLLVEQSAWSRR